MHGCNLSVANPSSLLKPSHHAQANPNSQVREVSGISDRFEGPNKANWEVLCLCFASQLAAKQAGKLANECFYFLLAVATDVEQNVTSIFVMEGLLGECGDDHKHACTSHVTSFFVNFIVQSLIHKMHFQVPEKS